MKKYKFSLGKDSVDQMWDFSRNNEVSMHFIRTPEPILTDTDYIAYDPHRRYLFDGIMTPETYLMFKLTVPGVQDE